MLRNFEEMVEAVKAHPVKRTMAIAQAEDAPVIDAALRAKHEGIVQPIFVGNQEKICELLRERDENPSDYNIVFAAEGEAGQRAVDVVREGSAHLLMKGLMETKDFLKPIVRKENELRTGHIMTHLVFFGVPNYHKLLMSTDGGMVIYPTLEDKRDIIVAAATALRAMDYDNPKFAVVCAIEKVNPKMVETVEAEELARMNRDGEITDCIVEGPLSYDVAMSRDIARHKGFDSDNVGDFDCLIMPNMQAGNILGKCLTVTVGAPMAGIIFGAKVPAVMTSRGSDAMEKYYSIAMATLVAAGMEHKGLHSVRG